MHIPYATAPLRHVLCLLFVFRKIICPYYVCLLYDTECLIDLDILDFGIYLLFFPIDFNSVQYAPSIHSKCIVQKSNTRLLSEHALSSAYQKPYKILYALKNVSNFENIEKTMFAIKKEHRNTWVQLKKMNILASK